MRFILKGSRTTLTPALKIYIEDKLVRPIGKILASGSSVTPILEIEFARWTRHHKKGKVWYAEANFALGKRVLRAEAFGENPRESIDILQAELMREVKKFKEKNKTEERKGARIVKRTLRRGRTRS